MPICSIRQTIQSACTDEPVQYQYADRVDSWNENEASGICKHESIPCFNESCDNRSQAARSNKREPLHQRMVLREKLAICCTVASEAVIWTFPTDRTRSIT